MDPEREEITSAQRLLDGVERRRPRLQPQWEFAHDALALRTRAMRSS